MRALEIALVAGALVGALLVLQSAAFFLLGRGEAALQTAYAPLVLGLGLPLALAWRSRGRVRALAGFAAAFAALSILLLATSFLARAEPAACDDTAMCAPGPESPLVMLGLGGHVAFALLASLAGAVACVRARALPGAGRWVPLVGFAAGLLVFSTGSLGFANDWVVALAATIAASTALAVLFILVRAPRGTAVEAREVGA